ncbi:DUF502 domain-containing protein [Deferribacter autotrophicus]|uniref:DUF502 domain-containing protein n=1 Tax=Deferribacter autotrophicus TaxID=500465 RepID=A0A5A8F5H1_9BACT|nr:DUF502 domain-containing protein [Deferribacter autotrophicus]KAA0259307.1 DUF502 domain-containing protein [Deferribacter autotrophicus]
MKRFKNYLRNTFIAGIFTVLPIIVTYFFLSFVFNKFSGFLIPYLRIGVRYIPLQFNVAESWLRLISFVLMMLIIFLIGLFTKNYLGSKFLYLLDKTFKNIPFVKTIYTSTKQIIDAFQTSKGANFKKVVLLEYPRKGIYSLGFVTKDTSDFFNNLVNDECYNIFIPTTPNPTSGFILIVPKKDVIELNITIEDSIKFVISAGLVSPDMIKDKDES